MEGLLKQFTEKIRNVTPSTLRTVAAGLDLLDDLCVPGLPPDLLKDRPLRFLVVDNDMISRQALAHSLTKAFSQPDFAVDGETALAQATKQAYDVTSSTCKCRAWMGSRSAQKFATPFPTVTTPVVFSTRQSDFDARCKSTLSGGSDLMGKPFLTFEVTVKALTLAFHGRLRGRNPEPLPKLDQTRGIMDSSVTIMDSPLASQVPPSPRDGLFRHRHRRRWTRSPCLLDPRVKTARPLVGTLSDDSSDLEHGDAKILLVDGFLRIN